MMTYSYQTQREKIFTDEGQRLFLKVRDTAARLLKEAGAVRMDAIMRTVAGDSWGMLACVDRLVELGEIEEIAQAHHVAGQHRVFVKAE